MLSNTINWRQMTEAERKRSTTKLLDLVDQAIFDSNLDSSDFIVEEKNLSKKNNAFFAEFIC